MAQDRAVGGRRAAWRQWWQLPNGLAIDSVCGPDKAMSTRYDVAGVLCDGENKCLVATDGQALVAVPAPGMPDGQVTAIMPAHALRCYRRYAKHSASVHIKVTTESTTVSAMDGTDTERFPMSRYPNVEGSFPDYRKMLDGLFKGPIDATLAIDAVRLLKIANALGSDVVYLGMKINPKNDATGSVRIVGNMSGIRAVLLTSPFDGSKDRLPPCKKKGT